MRDDGIGADVLRMLHQQVIGLLARRLGQIGIDGDVAAEERLERAADVADDAARAHGDAAHHAEMPHDAVAGRSLVVVTIMGAS